MTYLAHQTYVLQSKKAIKMGQAKIAAILTGSVNFLLYFFAFIANLDTIKSTILFIMAIIMSGYRFYRWTITSGQNKRLKDLQLRREELEIMERENEIIREAELKIK